MKVKLVAPLRDRDARRRNPKAPQHILAATQGKASGMVSWPI